MKKVLCVALALLLVGCGGLMKTDVLLYHDFFSQQPVSIPYKSYITPGSEVSFTTKLDIASLAEDLAAIPAPACRIVEQGDDYFIMDVEESGFTSRCLVFEMPHFDSEPSKGYYYQLTNFAKSFPGATYANILWPHHLFPKTNDGHYNYFDGIVDGEPNETEASFAQFLQFYTDMGEFAGEPIVHTDDEITLPRSFVRYYSTTTTIAVTLLYTQQDGKSYITVTRTHE